jgi:hypothetical protein
VARLPYLGTARVVQLACDFFSKWPTAKKNGKGVRPRRPSKKDYKLSGYAVGPPAEVSDHRHRCGGLADAGKQESFTKC